MFLLFKFILEICEIVSFGLPLASLADDANFIIAPPFYPRGLGFLHAEILEFLNPKTPKRKRKVDECERKKEMSVADKDVEREGKREGEKGSGGRGRAGGGTKKERKKGQTRFRFRR